MPPTATAPLAHRLFSPAPVLPGRSRAGALTAAPCARASVDARLAHRLASYDVLVVPGWNNSGPRHWQTLWQARFPEWRRVEQHDWAEPRREDWIAALDAAVAASARPVVLVAHSLGCVTAALWAQRAAAGRVAAALLVAPADVERPSVAAALRNFAPLPRTPLPFPALVVASDDDPACSAPRARALARDWDAELVLLHGHGHINADSGLADWRAGRELLDGWLHGGRG